MKHFCDGDTYFTTDPTNFRSNRHHTRDRTFLDKAGIFDFQTITPGETIRAPVTTFVNTYFSKLFIFEGSHPQKTRETRSRAQSPAQPHHTGLHGLDSNSTCAVWGPPRPAATVGELFSNNVRAQEVLERYNPPKTAQTAQCESPETSPGV